MSDNTISAQPVLDLSGAMLPIEKTLKQRQNVFLQFGRFMVFNFRIMKMVFKGHHSD